MAASLARVLVVWWSAFFAALTVVMMCVCSIHTQDWGPKFDFSGDQAITTVLSPYFLACWLPLVAFLFLLPSFAEAHKLSPWEQGMMVWFLTNVFWFHTGCDILSGYYQVMPNLTDLYKVMTPSHNQARWAPDRAFLDSVYIMELLCALPLCIWVLILYVRRSPARYIAEVFAVAVQLAGTVCYYAPPLMRGEATASYLSYCDRLFGSVWIIFPLIVLRSHFLAAIHEPLTIAVDMKNGDTTKENIAEQMATKLDSDKSGARKRTTSPGAPKKA